MKVWVVWDRVVEQVMAVYSTEGAAQNLCQRLEQRRLDQGRPAAIAATWYEYLDFEVDQDPEADRL